MARKRKTVKPDNANTPGSQAFEAGNYAIKLAEVREQLNRPDRKMPKFYSDALPSRTVELEKNEDTKVIKQNKHKPPNDSDSEFEYKLQKDHSEWPPLPFKRPTKLPPPTESNEEICNRVRSTWETWEHLYPPADTAQNALSLEKKFDQTLTLRDTKPNQTAKPMSDPKQDKNTVSHTGSNLKSSKKKRSRAKRNSSDKVKTLATFPTVGESDKVDEPVTEVPKIGTAFRPRSIETMATQPATVTGILGILPPELVEIVYENMCWSAAIHLAATNQYYRHTINPSLFATKKQKWQFLRSQEEKFSSPKIGRSWYACTGCWILKPEKRFQAEQVRAVCHKRGGWLGHHRRCLDCEIKEGKYQYRERIMNAVGKTMRLCRGCNEFRTGLFCLECYQCTSCLNTEGPCCPKCTWLMMVPPEQHLEGGRLI